MKSKMHNHLAGWLRLLRAGLLFIFDSIILQSGRKKTLRREGAIFCLHGLGDLLLAGHAITRLAGDMRARGLRAVLFVHPARVEFARRYLDVDEVEGIDRHRFTRKLSYRARVLKTVSGRFALAVQPTYNRMLRVEDALLRATGAPEKIGSAGHAPFIWPIERKLGDRYYTRLIEPQSGPLHELERHAEFMAGLGLVIPAEPWLISQWDPPPKNVTLPPGDYLVVSANASDLRRSWSVEKFLQAAQQIATQHRLAVVFIGDKKNSLPIRWPDVAAGQPELIDLCGQTATADLPGVLARAKLVISNDSGTYHLGVSLNRPTLAVGGSGLPARYFPYPRESLWLTKVLYHPVPCAGCNWRCLYTKSRSETAWCLRQISWPELAAAADELLCNRT
jgi:ADP-heptose:LPS heptosyltransferase